MTAIPYPPGPRTRFAGYYLWRRQRNPLRFYEELAQRYGDICHYQSGRQHVYCLHHPDLVDALLIGQSRSFTKGILLTESQRLIGQGLLTSEAPLHPEQRRATQPAFHRACIASYVDTMARLATQASTQWRDGQSIVISEQMSELTLAIVAATLFAAADGEDRPWLRRSIAELLRALDSMSMPWTHWLNALGRSQPRRLRQALAFLDLYIEQILDPQRGSDDVLPLLLQAHSTAGQNAGERRESLRDEVLTLLLAGSITIAQTLTWIWYLLAQHPEVERCLHTEVDAVLGGREPGVDDVPRLTYTRMIVAETLRLYPPVWIMGRRAVQDCTIGGYPIRVGSIVLASQYLLHRDPRYFPKPQRFDPERWTAEAQAARPRFSYFPFGAGRRSCIGEPFAWTEGIVVLASLARHWQIRPISAQTPALHPGFILQSKGPLRMIAQRRA